MQISKTLFKNLTRCSNFCSLMNLHQNRLYHDVKKINGFDIAQLENGLNKIGEFDITEVNEELREIFGSMFDNDGNDLTEVTNAQMEAFAEVFTEVEQLAIEQVKNIFGPEIIASINTFEQKKFSYTDDGNTYYCYLDGYLENEDTIKIFEVKATTSRKYDEMFLTIRKSKKCSGAKLPLFRLDNDGISRFIGYEYINTTVDNTLIDLEKVNKSKQKLYNRFSDEGKYIYDLAVEQHIVERGLLEKKNKIKKVEYYLIVLNSHYLFDGTYVDGIACYNKDRNGHQLFKIYDMTPLTTEIQDDILIQKNKLKYYLSSMEITNNIVGKHCEYKKTTQCKYFSICFNKALQPGSILELTQKTYAFKDQSDNPLTMYDLLNNQIYQISQCLPYLCKIDNLCQYDCVINNKIYVDKERITKAIRQIRYPIYHLDFESYNYPLPRYKGEKAYMQSLFQYSLHIERNPGQCDLINDHYEYLAPDHLDHREDLIISLINNIDLSNGGIVMVYNQNFEKTRLYELAKIFPKYKEQLNIINEHIFDLLAILNGNKNFFASFMQKEDLDNNSKPSFTYYHKKMSGSFSIKKILPLFTNLSYHDLEVKNGTEAILAYGMLPKLTDLEYQKIYLALRVYCRQDTWAMVEILRGLREIVKS